jgi:NADH dehydrogenase
MSRFSPIIPIMGKGQSLLQPIHVNAVAKAFVEALKESRSQRATLDLCGYEKLTFCQIIDQIMQVTNRKRLKLHIPLSIANVLATGFEYLFPLLLRQAPPLNRDQLIMLQENNIGEAEPAHDLFGLPRIRFAEGIRQYL